MPTGARVRCGFNAKRNYIGLCKFELSGTTGTEPVSGWLQEKD
jgi:hypothetical protein